MISKDILKQVLASNQKDVENYKIVPRTLPSDDFTCRVFIGVRRAGKSFMLYQKIQQMLALGHNWEEMLYLNFEDDRLAQFDRSDFEMILEAHAEMYGKRPMLFLDEIQNIEGLGKVCTPSSRRKVLCMGNWQQCKDVIIRGYDNIRRSILGNGSISLQLSGVSKYTRYSL